MMVEENDEQVHHAQTKRDETRVVLVHQYMKKSVRPSKAATYQ